MMTTKTVNRSATLVVRCMAIEGLHLAHSFADTATVELGWKKVWAARRIARRLGVSLQALGVVL